VTPVFVTVATALRTPVAVGLKVKVTLPLASSTPKTVLTGECDHRLT
jgi:hypothetical protein